MNEVPVSYYKDSREMYLSSTFLNMIEATSRHS